MRRISGVPKATTKQARRLVREFDQAARNHAWVGSGEPEEDAKLEPEYRRAKTALLKYIAGLERAVALSGRKEVSS